MNQSKAIHKKYLPSLAVYSKQAKRIKSKIPSFVKHTVPSNVVLTHGVWHTVIVTQENGKQSLFVDGLFVSSIAGLVLSKDKDENLAITYNELLLSSADKNDWTLSFHVKKEPTAAPLSDVLNLL